MEAPKKIYIQSFNISEEDAKFDKSKMFFDDVWTEEPELGQENIEYIRKDVSVEKAVSFIRNCTSYDGLGYKAKCVNIEHFKKYMED